VDLFTASTAQDFAHFFSLFDSGKSSKCVRAPISLQQKMLLNYSSKPLHQEQLGDAVNKSLCIATQILTVLAFAGCIQNTAHYTEAHTVYTFCWRAAAYSCKGPVPAVSIRKH
jgi:hypothetical protein